MLCIFVALLGNANAIEICAAKRIEGSAVASDGDCDLITATTNGKNKQASLHLSPSERVEKMKLPYSYDG